MKDTNVIFRTEKGLKEKFASIIEKEGVSISASFTWFMRDVVKRGRLTLIQKGAMLNLTRTNKTQIDIVFIKKALNNALEKTNIKTVKKVYLFGSYARGTANLKSDIDLRMECERGTTLFDIGYLSETMKELTGVEVDIVTKKPADMEPTFYSEIKRDEICIYEQN